MFGLSFLGAILRQFSRLCAAFLVLLFVALFASQPLKAETIDFRDFDIADYHGKVVYLDFWATWCGVCIKTMPWLEEMQQRYGGEDFEVVSVNIDESDRDFKRYMKHHKPGFKVVRDNKGYWAREYAVIGTPTSFLIGRDGEVAFSQVGFRMDSEAVLEASVRTLMSKVPQTASVTYQELSSAQ